MRMNEHNAILMTYFRNNVLHLFAMPSLVACAFLNNPSMRHEDIQRLVWRVYPYVRAELCLRWREEELPGVVDGVLAALAAQGLLETGEGGSVRVHQDVRLYRAVLSPGQAETLAVGSGRGVYVQVARGTLRVNEHELKAGDAVEIEDVNELALEGVDQAEALVFDLA